MSFRFSKTSGWAKIVLGVFMLSATPGLGWESLTFNLPSGATERRWGNELARRWNGETEQRIEGGRIDVLTAQEAVEVEFPHKWHEGVGQALHYASATGKQGVVAIIAYAQGEENLRLKTRQKLELIEKHCMENGLRMVVLFPNRGEVSARRGESAETAPRYWLNPKSGIRHNEDCPYFRKSKKGMPCGSREGKPCQACGG